MIHTLHTANIVLHIVSGVFAFAVGVWVLARPKGDSAHRRRGRWFVGLMLMVVATAAIGAVLFRAAPTLIAVTVLVSYQVFSAWRAATRPTPAALDGLCAVAALLGGGGFGLYLAHGAAAYWSAQVTIPIAATLVAITLYDLARIAAPRWRARVRALEHGTKMVMAIGALVSAGAGTVFPNYHPWSQIGPSIAAAVYIVGYLVWRRASREVARASCH
jgi:hypothetical protein